TSADIKLQQLKKTLDTQGIEIIDNQKESVLDRKQFADRTKGRLARHHQLPRHTTCSRRC
ncbi:hypothetical protein BDR07DRAFT_1308299, partial [Suillus spraguei]